MSLLGESKRAWLLSFLLFTGFFVCLYLKQWDNIYGKTIGKMIAGNLLIAAITFLLIIIFKMKNAGRMIAAAGYLGLIIYQGINGELYKWYVIVPTFIIMELYLLWNLGGVINCIVAEEFEDKIRDAIWEGQELYQQYSTGVDYYNEKNELGFFTKVRKKFPPDWAQFEFHPDGIKMFGFSNALFGIETIALEQRLDKMKKINANLESKQKAIDGNKGLHEEMDMLCEVASKKEKNGEPIDRYEKGYEKLQREKKEKMKKEKKILKRRL